MRCYRPAAVNPSKLAAAARTQRSIAAIATTLTVIASGAGMSAAAAGAADAATSASTTDDCLFNACSVAGIDDSIQSSYADVGSWITDAQLPIVYHEWYNISFFGLEKLHPFDACKFRKVVNGLVSAGKLTKAQLVAPQPASDQALLDVHSPQYLKEMNSSNLRIVQVRHPPASTTTPASSDPGTCPCGCLHHHC